MQMQHFKFSLKNLARRKASLILTKQTSLRKDSSHHCLFFITQNKLDFTKLRKDS